MKYFVSTSLLFLITLSSYSQKIKGKIIANGASASYVEVKNINSEEQTFSNNAGHFEIKVQIKDTLLFRSPFLKDTKTVIDSTALKNGLFIQLTEKRFDLAEVVISTTPFEFNIDDFNYEFKMMLQEDVAKNPFLYKPKSNYEGVNLLGIADVLAEGIIQLFGIGKNKNETLPPIDFDDIEQLFIDHSFFTKKLLTEELKIKPNQKYMFFDLCETKKLDASLLQSKNQFLLLDELMKISEEFRKNLKD